MGLYGDGPGMDLYGDGPGMSDGHEMGLYHLLWKGAVIYGDGHGMGL